jgi:fatty-acyl-CoA synthase
MDMPCARTMGEVLEEIASRSPVSTAIIYEHEQISYAALNLQVDRVARGLLALGLRRGDVVAALIGNQPEWVVTSFAAARIGAVFAPLNTWHRRSELDWTIRHTEAKALICLNRFLGHDYAADMDALMPELARSAPGQLTCQRFPSLRCVTMIGAPRPGTYSWEELLELGRGIPAGPLSAAAEAVQPDDLLIILYTSGSTAEPKGVTLRHRGVVENSFNIGERRGIRASDRVWLGSPLFYALGAVNCLPATISHGATLILQGHFTAARAIEVIRRERATIFYGTSNMIRAMVADPAYARQKLSSLRGGSAGISVEERRIIIQEIGAAQATQSYGLTETYGNAAGGFPEDSLYLKLQTAGKPLPGFEFRIVDPKTRRPEAAGRSGLLLVRGYVTDGYFKDPEQTALAFDSDGWFDTGDLGRIGPDGYFYFESRLKEIIKVGGINVSPTEVEQLLLRHPAVRQAHVVGIPHPVHDQMVVAIVEPAVPVTEDELRTYVRQVAASFKVPQHVLFRADSQIPRLATGKVARQKLTEDAISELIAAPD